MLQILMSFEETCKNCGKVIVANSQNTLTLDMALHMKKHEVDVLQEMEAETLKAAPKYVDSDSAAVIDKQVKGNVAYITVQSRNGKKVTVQYDMNTKKPIAFKPLN